MVMTTSAPFAASAALVAVFPPTAVNACSDAGLMSKPVTVWPALTRLAAMGAPMLPRPMNPIVAISEHLKDVVDGTFGKAIARADGDDTIEPVVLRRRGVERDRSTEIILRRIDKHTRVDLLHHRRRTVTHSAIDHSDRRAIVGFQHDANIQRGGPVRPPDDPIRTPRQHDAFELRSLEFAAGDEPDTAVAIGRRADRLHAGDSQGHGHQMGGADFGHGRLPPV